MTPSAYRTRAAKKNLREGITKMEQRMTPAAQVRRDFRLGRPQKTEIDEPLHPAVVWQRANRALADFRARMSAAELKPDHAEALIVYVAMPDMDVPHFLSLESAHRTPEECQRVALEQLGQGNALALGMVFTQFDEQTKQQALFPYQFMPLSDRGIAVLRRSAMIQDELIKQTKTAN